MTTSVVFAAVLLTWGCASTLPPIQLDGRAAEVNRLVGEWMGDYITEGLDGGRGSIYFALVGGEDHAHGNIVMTPTVGTGPAMDREPVGPTNRRNAEPRNIHFVSITAGQVSGTLDPTWDAERNCWAWTVFRGDLNENTIIGTFRTTFSRPYADVTGRWRVDRHFKK